MNKLRSLLALPLIAFAMLSLSACGGDDSAEDLDPAEVLEQAFSGEHEVNSGVLEVSASGEVPGDEGGSGSLTVTAPFNSTDGEEVPEAEVTIDLEGEAQGQSLDFSAGGTLTADGATVNFQETDYAVPAEFFDQLVAGLKAGMAQAEDSDGSPFSLEDLGIDPLSWFTNLTNEGSEEIDGTETVHVSGDADIVAIGEDLIGAVEEAGIPGAELPEDFDPSQLAFLEGFFEEVSFDLYAEEDGSLLRRLEVTIRLANLSAASGGEGPDSASLEFSVTLNEPNEEQEIELPTDTRPLDELEKAIEDEFGEAFGLDGLGVTPDIPGLPGGDKGSGGDDGKSGKTELPGVDQDYLDCIANANSPEELAKCAEGLE